MRIRKTLITACVILVYGQSAMGQSRIVLFVMQTTKAAYYHIRNVYKAGKRGI